MDDGTNVSIYTYDGNNLRQSKTVNGVTTQHIYNGMNVVQEKTYTDGRESSNMSISGRIGGSSLKVYKYDAFNRLIQYNDSASEATYTYGADNLRASKTINGTKTDFVWNGQNLAGETKNSITTAYTYDPTGIALYRTNGETTRYIKDAHGNVVATTRNNSIAGEYDYTAFGVQQNSTDTSNPFRYCGEYYDNESGLIYLRNRYYNSSTGRFITEDPVKDGLNWYSYCAGNSVMFVDPLGLRDVLLKYVINDLGGTVSWENGATTVTLGGITKTYTNLEVINGRSIIDNEILDKDFSEYAGQFVHDDNDGSMSTDRFECEEDAALAFSLTYYGFSLSDGYEYGCVILEGIDASGKTYYTMHGSKTDKSPDSVSLPTNKVTAYAKQVSTAHTHGADINGYRNENFSGIINDNGTEVGDLVVAYNMEHKTNYLMTPSKKFKQLDGKVYDILKLQKQFDPNLNIEFIDNKSGFVKNYN